MEKSPGHREHPDHHVREEPVDRELRVKVDGEEIAKSSHVIRVDEDEHPVRNYFPRSDVRMDHLEPSDKTSDCPFKGHATYFNIRAGDQTIENAAWSYEDPYEEHRDLRERIAFHQREMEEIQLVNAG